MRDVSTRKPGSRRFAPLGILFACLGLFLFAYFVKRAGASEIVSGIQRLGAGFLAVLAISSIRFIVRGIAWCKCFEGEPRLRFWDAIKARIMGDALGNLVPFGAMVVSEPAK